MEDEQKDIKCFSTKLTYNVMKSKNKGMTYSSELFLPINDSDY
jgi:hypothetical protein